MKLSVAHWARLSLAMALIAGVRGLAAAGPTLTAVADTRSPGGDTTYTGEIDRQAYSHPATNLHADRSADFEVGRGLFKRRWVAAPASVPTAAEGLGPLFNARSCDECHTDAGRGHPIDATGAGTRSMVVRLARPPRTEAERHALASGRIKVVPDPTYGAQIQPLAIAGQVGEGQPIVAWQERPATLGDGSRVWLRAPSLSVRDPVDGPLDPETQLAARVAPALVGLGLLESIDESDVLSRADPQDADGDGISGRPHRVWSQPDRRHRLGRFGWKASEATLNDQIQAAFSLDLGVSVPLHPASTGDCTGTQTACRQARFGGDAQGLEADGTAVAAVVLHTRNLAVPKRRTPNDPRVVAGEALFLGIGCARCHRPSFVTGADTRHPEQSGQRIWPYTDLLLHDLGDGLADRLPEGEASGREWRTAPLWGIGLTQTVSDHGLFLHDGRARGLVEAILWHGGEAQGSRDAFAALPQGERDRVLRFLESL